MILLTCLCHTCYQDSAFTIFDNKNKIDSFSLPMMRNFIPTSIILWIWPFIYSKIFFWCAPFGHQYFSFFSIVEWTRIVCCNWPGMALTPFPSSLGWDNIRTHDLSIMNLVCYPLDQAFKKALDLAFLKLLMANFFGARQPCSLSIFVFKHCDLNLASMTQAISW